MHNGRPHQVFAYDSYLKAILIVSFSFIWHRICCSTHLLQQNATVNHTEPRDDFHCPRNTFKKESGRVFKPGYESAVPSVARCVLPEHHWLPGNNFQVQGCALLSSDLFPCLFWSCLPYSSGQRWWNLVNNVPVNAGRHLSSHTIWKRNRCYPHVWSKRAEKERRFAPEEPSSCHPEFILKYLGLG